jgi:hypothetical protein
MNLCGRFNTLSLGVKIFFRVRNIKGVLEIIAVRAAVKKLAHLKIIL